MSERIVNVHEQDYAGKHFRSTLEAQTAKTLDALGIPYSYEERKIELLEGFRSPFQKDKVRSITYTPDFIIGPIMLECKGFETPEWKLKKKLLFKWLKENDPDTIFYQIHDAGRSLLEALDKHWAYLGMAVKVTPKPVKEKQRKKQKTQSTKEDASKSDSSVLYDSVEQAMNELNLIGKPKGTILSSLVGKRDFVYNYNWDLVKITL